MQIPFHKSPFKRFGRPIPREASLLKRIRNLEIENKVRKKKEKGTVEYKKKNHSRMNSENISGQKWAAATVDKEEESILEVTINQFTPDHMVLGTDSGGWNSIWYVSNNSTIHVSTYMHTFMNFKSFDFEGQSENSVISNGIGEVVIPSNNREYVFPYVTYKPNIGFNILSYFQLIAQGFIVEFVEGKCVIKRMFEDELDKIEIIEESVFEKQEKLDELERNIGIDITKRMLTEFVSNKCDKIGESSSRGLSSNICKNDMVIPSDLQKVIDYINEITLGKFTEEVKDDFANNFDRMLSWFHKEFLGKPLEKEIPPFVVYKQICLMDMFRTIKDLGSGSKLFVKGEWDQLANAFGFPVDYARTFEVCYLDYLHQLELYYDIGGKLLKEYEKEVVVWNGTRIKLEVDTYQGYISFMDILKHAPTAGYKELLKRKFQDVVIWFHKDFMGLVFYYPMPPKVGKAEIDLFDLFVLVDGMGGNDKIVREDHWDIVAMSFGFPPWLKHRVQGIFDTYLSMLDSFHSTVKDERNARSSKVENAETLTADHIELDDCQANGTNFAGTGITNEEGEDQIQKNETEDDQEDTTHDEDALVISLEEGSESEEEDPSITDYYYNDGSLGGIITNII